MRLPGTGSTRRIRRSLPLARSTRARVAASEGAAVRDETGRHLHGRRGGPAVAAAVRAAAGGRDGRLQRRGVPGGRRPGQRLGTRPGRPGRRPRPRPHAPVFHAAPDGTLRATARPLTRASRLAGTLAASSPAERRGRGATPPAPDGARDVAAQQPLHQAGQPSGTIRSVAARRSRDAPPAVPGDHGALEVFLPVGVQLRVRNPQEEERVRAEVQLPRFLGQPQAGGRRHDRPEPGLGDGNPVSSKSSRTAAAWTVSPRCTPPPGVNHQRSSVRLPRAEQQDPPLGIGHKKPRGRPPDRGLVHKPDITDVRRAAWRLIAETFRGSAPARARSSVSRPQPNG